MKPHATMTARPRPVLCLLAAAGALVACSSGGPLGGGEPRVTGDDAGGAYDASARGDSGSSSSSGATTQDSSTGPGPDASESDEGAAGDAPVDDAGDDSSAVGTGDDASYGSPDANYGGVGQLVPIPIQYTPQPVPPIIPPDCPGDPTQGFTEYTDTFVIQRPYDLAASDRFSYENGIYTFWVYPNDKPHEMNNTTAPRTEARYSDMSTGTRIWSADVMFETPLNDTCVMQIHNESASIAAYYRVLGGRMFNLGTGQTVLTGYYDKWFNMKVVFDMDTHQVNTYINNCLKDTHATPTGPTPNWYFKNGVYTCQATMCRDHFKNLHLYKK